MKYLRSVMLSIVSHPIDDVTADMSLINAIKCEMTEKLGVSRMIGRHGWWDENVISIDELYALRDNALTENDHVSVINYTAMIAAREQVED